MLLWSLVLYIVFLDFVTADTRKNIGKGQKTEHEIVKKDIREDGPNSDGNKDDEGSSGENIDDKESLDNSALINNDYSYDDGKSVDGDTVQSDESFLPEDFDSQGSTEVGKPGKDFQTRSLHAGDIFTPRELLPVTIRLLKKVDNHGEGRGIVSSSKSPEDLADRLFGGYFLTMKRIVYLNEKDLAGLDALQALALEGEDALGVRAAADSVTEAPTKIMEYGGQLIEVEKYPGRCHYKLIYKKIDPTPKAEVTNDIKENTKSDLRTGNKMLKLEKKMRPNRHLVVKYGRKLYNGTNITVGSDKDIERGRNKKRRRHKINKSHKKGTKRKPRRNRKHRSRQKNSRVNKNKKSKQNRKHRGRKTRGNKQRRKYKNRRNSNVLGQATTTVKPTCKWRYHCRTPGDLDSCRLHTSCIDESNPRAYIDDIFVDHREDEHDESVKQFRKMSFLSVGITILDEDVEKIIEQHVLQVKPENMRGVDKIETLDEYFNNIIMAQHSRTTTPIPNLDSFESSIEKIEHEVNSESDAQQASSKDVSSPQKLSKSSGEQQDHDVKDEELRASQNKEKYKETNSTSQPPDKNSSLPTISTTKS